MLEQRESESNEDDYRGSHLEKGADYDGVLEASAFDRYMARWEAYWLKSLLRDLYPSGIARYLDFACGTGRITQLVGSLAKESIGVDISPKMLDVARRKCPETKFVQLDLTRDETPLGQFEVITCFRFLGNAQNELRESALDALVALLRPGGHLFLNNHRNPLALAAILHRVTGGRDTMDLTYYALRRLLAARGLKIVAVRAIGFWMFRSRLMDAKSNPHAREWMERAFRWGALAPFAPDSLVVGQKIR